MPAMHVVQKDTRIAILSGPLAAEILKSWIGGAIGDCTFTLFTDPKDLEHPVSSDLIIIGDLFNLPEYSGENLLQAIKRQVSPAGGPPVAVISDGDRFTSGLRCLQAGARGFIPTHSSLAVTVSALRLILTGGVYVPFEIVGDMTGRWDGRRAAGPAAPRPTPEPDRARFGGLPPAQLSRLGLSRRETQILGYLQQGSGNKQIAQTLGISDNTVMVHMRNLMRKLGATNRAQAVFKARQKLMTMSTPAPGA